MNSPEKLLTLFQAIDKKLSMNQFDDKLEIQKITYLAQEYGIDLEYEFEWNKRGPYCKQVSEHAHIIIDSSRNISIDNNLKNEKEKLSQFVKIIKPYMDNTEWLEIAASLLYLRKDSYENMELNQIIGYLIEDLTYGYKNFNEALVRKAISEMSKKGFLT